MYGEPLEDLTDLDQSEEDRLSSLLDLLKVLDKYDVVGPGDEIALLIFPMLDAARPTMKTTIETVYALSASTTEAIRRAIALTCHKKLQWILSECDELATLISKTPDLSFALLKNRAKFDDYAEIGILCPRCKSQSVYSNYGRGTCNKCCFTFNPLLFTAQLLWKKD